MRNAPLQHDLRFTPQNGHTPGLFFVCRGTILLMTNKALFAIMKIVRDRE